MKKHIHQIFALLLLILASCNPNLVDEPPLGPTEQTFFTNANEFRAQLTGVYAAFYDHYHFAAPSFNFNGWVTGTWLLPGDDLTENLGARTAVELFDGSLNPTNAQLGFVFPSCYKAIARANVTIDKVRTVDFSGFEGAEEIARMQGEALFLRAYAYFVLFNVYGSVPVVTERLLTEAQTNTPKSPAIDVLSQVIADSEAAIASLPESWDAANRGRITKNSARGLLAKALVFRGNYNNNAAADYQQALTVFNSITATLVPDYVEQFQGRDRKQRRVPVRDPSCRGQ